LEENKSHFHELYLKQNAAPYRPHFVQVLTAARTRNLLHTWIQWLSAHQPHLMPHRIMELLNPGKGSVLQGNERTQISPLADFVSAFSSQDHCAVYI